MTAPGPDKMFQRLKLRLWAKCAGSGSASLQIIVMYEGTVYALLLQTPPPGQREHIYVARLLGVALVSIANRKASLDAGVSLSAGTHVLHTLHGSVQVCITRAHGVDDSAVRTRHDDAHHA